MQFSRARYVTLCQQSLVTGAVLVLGVSAAGVKTLDIVPAPSGTSEAIPAPQAGSGPEALSKALPAPRRASAGTATVDTAPVTPEVREVAVTGIETSPREAAAARRVPATPAPAPAKKAAPAKPAAPTSMVALSTPQKVTGYATVGVTWKHGVSYQGNSLIVQVRLQQDGAWSGWRTIGHDEEDGPDASSSELGPQSRPGTDALVVGAVDYVQMRAETTDGSLPPDLKLAVIDPGTGATATEKPAIDTAALPSSQGDQASTSGAQALRTTSGEHVDTAELSAMKVAPKPYIYSRAQWGANEKLREQSNPSYGTIKAGFIHHTVNANNYTSAQVPSLMRGIYAYHTQSRGWRDIGYNFLVDRFGRIWEGRWGGVDRAVVGAHTLGYNEVAFAMSAIGNFDIANPPQAVSDAYARLFAWKLSAYDIRADAMHIYVKNRFMNAINGHRDVGQTACPGRYLYAKIPAIRAATQALQNKAQSGTVTPPPPPPAPKPPAPEPTFTSPTQTPLPAATQPAITLPRGLSLTRSAYPDVVLKGSDGTVKVLPTGGYSRFNNVVGSPGHWGRMSLVVGVGDVTGDGIGDVLGRVRGTGVSRIFPGTSSGRISTHGIAKTKKFSWVTGIIGAGDWNKDRRTDLLVRGSRGSTLYLVPGLGDGKFGTLKRLTYGQSNLKSIAAVGDFDRDGTQDIVGLHKNGYLFIIRGTTSGGLRPWSTLARVGTGYDTVVGAGDMSGDGIPDVALRATNGAVTVFPGTGTGRLGRAMVPFTGMSTLGRLTGAPMAGSSQSDLIARNSSGTMVYVSLNNGLSHVKPLVGGGTKVPGASMVLNAGDWNRDGTGDLITVESGGDVLNLRPGLGNGEFGAPVKMSDGWDSFVNLVAVGDVTGDGRPDLVGRRSRGPMIIFPGNGSTGFAAPRLAPAALRTFNTIGSGAWAPAKMNGSAFWVLSGPFVPFAGTTGGRIGGYSWVVGPGDVNGDRRPDLLARDSAGTLWLLPGTATGYGAREYLAAGLSGYSTAG